MDQINEQQARALAAFIATIRDDWGVRGIVKALSDARGKADAAGLAQAAIRAAATPTNRTPAIIAMPGEHWGKGPKVQNGVEQAAALARHFETLGLADHHLAGEHDERRAPNCPKCYPPHPGDQW